MGVRYVTVHHDANSSPVWLAYVDEKGMAYVWVPELEHFAQNEALTADIAWHHHLQLRDVSPERAWKIVKGGQLGTVSDPSMRWIVDALAAAPSLRPEQVLPAPNRPSRADEVSSLFRRLKKNPGTRLVYAKYEAHEKAKANRAASDLRNGRVAAFARILPGMEPVVQVTTTDDLGSILVLVSAEPKEPAGAQREERRPGAWKHRVKSAARRKSVRSKADARRVMIG